MKRLARLAFVALGGWSGLALCAALTTTEIKTLPETAVEARLPAEPWASDYAFATRLWSAGEKDDAVFWYYAGQLRGRIYFAAHPGDQEQQEAFFATTLQLGESINLYAGADPVKWADTVNKVLAWDTSHDDPQTPKDQFPQQRDQTRQGLQKLHDWVLQNADKLRKANEARSKA